MHRNLYRVVVVAAIVAVGLGGSKATSAEETKPRPWYDTITLKGYIQLDAVFPEGNAVTGSYSNFRIRRARPTLTAMLDPLTRVQVQVDAGSGRPAQDSHPLS